MNEFELIARHFDRPCADPSVRLGVGDDAAILAPSAGHELLVSVDMLVEGRHFLPDVDPEGLGHKALAVNLSDLAAMGATPRWALLAGALPRHDARWLDGFTRGLFALADAHRVCLVGGDTTRGPLNLCITVLGEAPAGEALTRGGARKGDDVYVSGRLGEAAFALAVLQGRASASEEVVQATRPRLERPTPRIALGLALRGVASAAIDVSDGLVGDLGHILERSHVGAQIDLALLPTHPALAAQRDDPATRALAIACLLAGGDDYELCFTAAVSRRDHVAAIAQRLDLPLARIGSITTGDALMVRDERGVPLDALPRAYDHFAGAPG